MCGSLVRTQVSSPLSSLSYCPHRLARPRTPPFHGGDAGSNPAGDANFLFSSCRLFFLRHVVMRDIESIIVFSQPSDVLQLCDQRYVHKIQMLFRLTHICLSLLLWVVSLSCFVCRVLSGGELVYYVFI